MSARGLNPAMARVVVVAVVIVIGAVGTASGYAATATIASANVAKAGAYSGTTSESEPVSFTVAAGGTSVSALKASLGYNGKCGQGGGPGFAIDVAKASLSKSGTFTATTTGTAGSAKGAITIDGTISGGSAHGTIIEPKPYFTCRAPNQKVNPYSETFTAKVA